MTNHHLQGCPLKKKGVVFQSMPPDTVLLNLDNGFYYSINPIGAAVWEYCDGNRSISNIIAQISKESDVSADDIQEDILDFIHDLTKEGLIQIETNDAE